MTDQNTEKILASTAGLVPKPAVLEEAPPSHSARKLLNNNQSRDSPLPVGGPLLLEVSVEVCRKVGGIYTVLRTKVPSTMRNWEHRYALIGVYDPKTADFEFEKLKPSKLSEKALVQLREKYGINVRYGRWLVKGYPRVFLIDVDSMRHKVDEWRHDLMPNWGNPNDLEVNDALIFGYQAALLIKAIAETQPRRQFIAHFHEWNSAVGLIVARKWNLRVATVFTTHATLIGRYLCAGHIDMYRNLLSFDGEKEAASRGIYHRHWIEREAAHRAHVFSTVSDITAMEAQQLLGQKVDVVLPNGLAIQTVDALHEFQQKHQEAKEKLHKFVRGHFYGHFDFDLDKTLYLFTAGRREFTNKGVDLFLEALARLNAMLKGDNSDITIVAFIIMPGKVSTYNVETLQGQSVMRSLQHTSEAITNEIGQRMLETLARGEMPDPKTFLSDTNIVELKHRLLYIQRRSTLPPICTHNVVNDADDEILCALRRLQLFNTKNDRVKVVYHPEFVSATSPVLPFEYPEFVRACHLGVFPSYYEPWGYTPAECAVMGVPSITSNLAGFGLFMEKLKDDPSKHGIYIADRVSKTWEQTAAQISHIMYRFTQLTRRERIELRNRTERLSPLLDWTALSKHYFAARSLALERFASAKLQPSGSYENLTDLDDRF